MAMKNEYEQKLGSDVMPLPNVIIKFHNDIPLPYIDNLENYLVEHELAPWKDLESQFPGISIKRVYVSLSSEEIQKLEDDAFEESKTSNRPNLLKYFQIDCPPETDRESLVKMIAEWKIIERAYVPLSLDTPPDLPSSPALLQPLQFHLDPAPGSIGAEEAWQTPNADGRGIKFIDLERGWILNHENFLNSASASVFSIADPATSQMVAPVDPNYNYYMGHGTSVLGTVAAPDFGRNTIGIAFKATGQVVSIKRKLLNGQESIHDAITMAASLLAPGDVMLIEAQAKDLATGKLWPVEVNDLEYQEIRTATANGKRIIVIEPAGNGKDGSALGAAGNNLDTYTVPGTSTHVLDRTKTSPPEFKDSGAIMVGSASRTNPHSRMVKTSDNSESNFGNRVDCYAWGERISTTGGPNTNSYDSLFGSTSGASAMIAGVALIVQGLAKANNRGDNLNKTYSPAMLSTILTDPNLSTPSANPGTDCIGRMPDLIKIIDHYLNLGPDVYLRDFLGDTGAPHTGSISASPDVIVQNSQVPNYDNYFGQGSPRQNLDGLGETIIKNGNSKYLYVRVTNRGATDAQNVQVTAYWSEVATLITPSMWHAIGSNTLASVPAGQMKVCEIIWQDVASNPIPPAGHYCFVGIAGNPRDPAPANLSSFATWNDYYNFIRQINNVTWCNFNVVEMLASQMRPVEGGGGGDGKRMLVLPFLVTGAEFEDLPMKLEVQTKLSSEAQLWLEGLEGFLSALIKGHDIKLEDTKEKNIKKVRLKVTADHRFQMIPFHKNLREQMRLVIHLPAAARQQSHEIVLRQFHNDEEIGRITWRLVPPIKKGWRSLFDSLRRFFTKFTPLSWLLYLVLLLGLLILIYLILRQIT